MSSNLRSSPIYAYISDSAGNIIRNAKITIKQSDPSLGEIVILQTTSDDSGYFVTPPLKSGEYNVYESGMMISRILHDASRFNIQAYLASTENYPENLPAFTQTDQTSDNDINKFRYYLQIENNNLDIQNFGHIFPIYEPNLMVDSLSSFYIYHGLNANSRITTTRFNVEYFNALTSISNTYKKIRWAGVPAIMFNKDSKLVLPLDYYSIKANSPISINAFNTLGSNGIRFNAATFNDTSESIEIYDPTDLNIDFTSILNNAVKGGIFKLSFSPYSAGTTTTTSAPLNKVFYCILIKEWAYNGHRSLILKKWKSSNYISNNIDSDLAYMYNIVNIVKYDGFFNGISNLTVSVNEKFTVTENIYAQDLDTELYNYSNAI